MTDTTTLIQRLRDWRGDPDEVMAEAADALEQQAAQIKALQLTKAGLIGSLREEMDEGLRLRELGGALPDENITTMTERIIGERAAQAAELSALRADAERLIHERDHERAHREAAANMLVRIHALLNPPSVVADGSVYRFDNPNATDVLQLLSDRIRDVPHRLAAIDAALRQEQPNE